MKSTIVVYTGISWTRPPAKIIMHSIHIDVKHKNCMIGKSEYVHQKDTHLMKFLRPWLRLSSSDKLHASSCSFQAFYHLNSSHSGPCHFLVSGQKFLKTVKMSLLSIDVECRPRNENKNTCWMFGYISISITRFENMYVTTCRRFKRRFR